METKHTPTPWEGDPNNATLIWSKDDQLVCKIYGEPDSVQTLDKQRTIVRVVNSHDALVTALTAMSGRFLSLIKFNSELGSERGREFLQIINDAHKALALAGVQEYTIRPEPLL